MKVKRTFALVLNQSSWGGGGECVCVCVCVCVHEVMEMYCRDQCVIAKVQQLNVFHHGKHVE